MPEDHAGDLVRRDPSAARA